MGKCIDAEKLVEHLYKMLEKYPKNYQILVILDYIDSLQQEQPEVDLEKELDQWRHKHFKGKRDCNYNGEYLERESQLDLARHFYELGVAARREE